MAEKEQEAAKKKSKKLLIVVVPVVIGVLTAGFFMFWPGKAEAESGHGHNADGSHELGAVIRLAPMTMNLSDGHVLKVGLALQMVAEPKDEALAAVAGHEASASASADTGIDSPLGGEEAKALDSAIHMLGASTFEALSTPGVKQKLKDDLTLELIKQYNGDVVDVYYTNFVMS